MLRIIPSKAYARDQYQYESFQLRGESAGIKKINDYLWQKAQQFVHEEIPHCQKVALGQDSISPWVEDGTESVLQKPLAVLPNWVVWLTRDSSQCGGAHAFQFTYPQTWNMQTGELVNFSSWFVSRAVKPTKSDGTYIDALPAFRYFLNQLLNSQTEQDCNACDFESDHLIVVQPDAKGLIFNSAPTGALSDDEGDGFLVSYEQIAPWLNSLGRRSLKDFLTQAK